MKVSEFNVFVPSFREDTILAYNTLTGAFMAISAEKFEHACVLLNAVEEHELRAVPQGDELWESLVKNGFIVDDALNERAVVRARYYDSRGTSSAVALTIAPTVSCNFGCTYCFQEHPQRKMTPENVDAVKHYVSHQLRAGASLFVTWFGGEPLLAFEVIQELSEYFTRLCQERGSPFKQSMITNGSLLDEKKIAYFAAQGNFTYLQITLDGPPEVHDLRRVSAGGKPTFTRIFHNIVQAAGRLPMTIRVNVDRTNHAHLPAFIDLLKERGLRDKVSVYLGHVLPYTDVCSDVDSVALSKEAFAEVEAQFQFALLAQGFKPHVGLPKPRFGHFCVADNPNGAVLAPGNLMFRCWNEVATTEKFASGRLDGLQLIVEDANQKSWDDYDPFIHEMCQSCKVQPLCQGGCPWEARKNPTWSTGHCTPLKFNLPDRLRLYHLEKIIECHPPIEVGEETDTNRP